MGVGGEDWSPSLFPCSFAALCRPSFKDPGGDSSGKGWGGHFPRELLRRCSWCKNYSNNFGRAGESWSRPRAAASFWKLEEVQESKAGPMPRRRRALAEERKTEWRGRGQERPGKTGYCKAWREGLRGKKAEGLDRPPFLVGETGQPLEAPGPNPPISIEAEVRSSPPPIWTRKIAWRFGRRTDLGPLNWLVLLGESWNMFCVSGSVGENGWRPERPFASILFVAERKPNCLPALCVARTRSS